MEVETEEEKEKKRLEAIAAKLKADVENARERKIRVEQKLFHKLGLLEADRDLLDKFTVLWSVDSRRRENLGHQPLIIPPKHLLINLIKLRALSKALKRLKLKWELEDEEIKEVGNIFLVNQDQRLDETEEALLANNIIDELRLEATLREAQKTSDKAYETWLNESVKPFEERLSEDELDILEAEADDQSQKSQMLLTYSNHIQDFFYSLNNDMPDVYDLDEMVLPEDEDDWDVPLDADIEADDDADANIGGGDDLGEAAARDQAEAIEALNDPFMTIRVPNPFPRPARTFPQIQATPRGFCGTLLEDFPLHSYVLVKETLPLDWFNERGYVSLGGMLTRQEGSETINFKKTNTIYLKSFHNLENLNLEIVDSSFATYKIANGQKSAYLTLLLSVTKIL